MSQQACLTLYTAIKNANKIIESIQHHFEAIAVSYKPKADGIRVQLFDETTIEIHIITESKEIYSQISGMQNFFAQVPCQNKVLLDQALLQISMFNCIVGITFLADENKERTDAIIRRFFAVAKDCACIVLYPDMCLYTPEGKLLLSIDGNSELDDYHPIANADFVMPTPNFDEDDIKRYETITRELKEKGYPSISHILNTQISKEALHVHKVEEIAQRAIANFACAVYAEGILMENGSREIGLQEFALMDERYHCKDFLSEDELDFIQQRDVDENRAIQFSWRYECCAVLLWALGLMKLNTYESMCDVASMASILRSYASVDELCQAANRKSDEELLDMHTKALYYHWACVEADIHQQELDVNQGVIQEHHYALNWLCTAHECDDWDHIQTNT